MQIRNLRFPRIVQPSSEGIALLEISGTHLPTDREQLSSDGELAPRDETILLLQLAAEIEHALMVQYLYAAFSLEVDQSRIRGSGVPNDAANTTSGWKSNILRIAKQEMGHLICVQNILRSIGGPLHFGREDFPFSVSPFYPFKFTLEPLTRDLLAKFVAAERPELPDRKILPEAKESEILKRAKAEAGSDINRVGLLYSRLIEIFGQLPPSSVIFLSDTENLQASPDSEEWAGSSSGDHVLVRNFTGSPEQMRTQVVSALQEIAEQGEGIRVDDPERTLAHFRVFLSLYDAFPENIEKGGTWIPSRPVPVNPTIAGEAGAALANSISETNSQKIAHLGNIRYRMLLLYLQHTLRTLATNDLRSTLLKWAFNEMQMISLLGTGLSKQPRNNSKSATELAAAICFDMPYTIVLPERDIDCWRVHRDLLDANDVLLSTITRGVLSIVDPAGRLKSLVAARRPTVNQQLGL